MTGQQEKAAAAAKRPSRNVRVSDIISLLYDIDWYCMIYLGRTCFLLWLVWQQGSTWDGLGHEIRWRCWLLSKHLPPELKSTRSSIFVFTRAYLAWSCKDYGRRAVDCMSVNDFLTCGSRCCPLPLQYSTKASVLSPRVCGWLVGSDKAQQLSPDGQLPIGANTATPPPVPKGIAKGTGKGTPWPCLTMPDLAWPCASLCVYIYIIL